MRPLTLPGLLIRYDYQTLTPRQDAQLRQRLLTLGQNPQEEAFCRQAALDLLLVMSLTLPSPPDGSGLHPVVAPGDAASIPVMRAGSLP